VLRTFIRSAPCEAPVLSELRHELEHWLLLNGIPEQARSAVVLAAHEAAADAIEHASCRELQLKGWLEQDQIYVEVQADGSWKPPLEDELERGLTLISSLMNSFIVDAHRDRTIVRMRRTMQS
jgi:anti-sigma regulatory factor (Ser/Thr protein kinase)